MTRRLKATALVAVMLLSVVAGVGVAANDMLNYSADSAPMVVAETNVTKDVHKMSWGTDETAALTYVDNSGEDATLNGTYNKSVNNSFGFTVTDINVTDYGAFPHDKDGVTALDQGEWTKDASDSAGSGTISNVTTAPNVDAVELSTSSQTSGDKMRFIFSNFSVTSDVETRYFQIALDIDTLDAGTNVTITLNDTDGDYVAGYIDDNLNTETRANAIANGTGDGWLWQEQIGQLAVQGSGDGTMQEIDKVVVIVDDADATLQIAGLNVEKQSEWKLGVHHNESGDENPVYEVNESGDIYITGLDTMGPTFDNAHIRDLTVRDVWKTSKSVGAEHVIARFEGAEEYPQYEETLNYSVRIAYPDVYDLSLGANGRVFAKQQDIEDQYETVEHNSGSTADLVNVSYSTEATSNFNGSEDRVELITGGLSADTNYDVHIVKVLTGDEADALRGETGGETQAASGGGAGQQAGGEGGLFSNPLTWVAGLVAGILGWLGIGRGG